MTNLCDFVGFFMNKKVHSARVGPASISLGDNNKGYGRNDDIKLSPQNKTERLFWLRGFVQENVEISFLCTYVYLAALCLGHIIKLSYCFMEFIRTININLSTKLLILWDTYLDIE